MAGTFFFSNPLLINLRNLTIDYRHNKYMSREVFERIGETKKAGFVFELVTNQTYVIRANQHVKFEYTVEDVIYLG